MGMAFARQNWLFFPSTDRMFLIQTTPRYRRKSRVGNSRHNPSGRRWGRGLVCSMSTLSSRRYTYQSVPGRSGWPSRDPINEIGLQTLNRSRRSFDRNQEKDLYGFVANNPVNFVDIDGRRFFLDRKPCGTVVSRSIDPDTDPSWWEALHETISGVLYPHVFIILADGTRLTHGGTADGENHRTARKLTIYIRKCDSCSAFTACLKKKWPDDSTYTWYFNNCGHAVRTTIDKCGGMIEGDMW